MWVWKCLKTWIYEADKTSIAFFTGIFVHAHVEINISELFFALVNTKTKLRTEQNEADKTGIAFFTRIIIDTHVQANIHELHFTLKLIHQQNSELSESARRKSTLHKHLSKHKQHPNKRL